MPSIILKECPKVYILETHRSKTPDSTLQFIQSIKELVSMLDFREASDLDRIGIPVFICHRTRPDTGIPTVRMIVPGLETYCFDKMRIGARILKG